MVLLLCADLSKAWKSPVEHGYNTGEMDVSIVGTHMMLEAWELGIGSVWVRGFDPRQVAKAFALPPPSSLFACCRSATPARIPPRMPSGIPVTGR